MNQSRMKKMFMTLRQLYDEKFIKEEREKSCPLGALLLFHPPIQPTFHILMKIINETQKQGKAHTYLLNLLYA